ncbi:IclR family transcriptional regulator [Thalassospira xiamenensis]|uniref:IclR family transcriptional regulator n=2 Tax=Thalassospira xiamenensis TaxID=220697 RepID=A0A367XBC9_9PROT|nr:IclR family transcriptional regulator [Thalassospira xiamenensis]KZB55898.1 IclR family transcriptional regulator [Thalassospira xiamenensis]RCK50081.1 IclR family transcriptional regulator [Thalassospira xiamenensis]
MVNENYQVESVSKAFDLLMAVARYPHSGVTDLAKKTDLTKSRAFRLLHTMEQRQVVIRDKENGYRLGNSMLVLGITASSQIDLVKLANPILEELCQRVNETVQLRILDGNEALCIAKCEPSRDLRVHAVVGRRRPLYAGSPKALLAFQPRETIERCVPAKPEKFTSNSLGTRGAILAELSKIQQQRYCLSRGEVSDQLVSIAAPVFAMDGSAIAALNVAAPAFRTHDSELEHIIRLVTSSAERLSVGLGWQKGRI